MIDLAIDTKAPTWNETPQNQALEYNIDFNYDVNATDAGIGKDSYYLNDSTNFDISAVGVVTNGTLLPLGVINLNVSVLPWLNLIDKGFIA